MRAITTHKHGVRQSVGHRIEVVEQVGRPATEPVILAVNDLDTGIRFRLAEGLAGDVTRWYGRVLDCTVTIGATGSRTVLSADSVRPGAAAAKVALHGADAAADAAKAEADRWGGADRQPPDEVERFW